MVPPAAMNLPLRHGPPLKTALPFPHCLSCFAPVAHARGGARTHSHTELRVRLYGVWRVTGSQMQMQMQMQLQNAGKMVAGVAPNGH
jgi:hypothetical protein